MDSSRVTRKRLREGKCLSYRYLSGCGRLSSGLEGCPLDGCGAKYDCLCAIPKSRP